MADDPKPASTERADGTHRPAVVPVADSPAAAELEQRRRHILRDTLFKFLIAILLILAKELIDRKTDAGAQLELSTYAWLEHRLGRPEPAADLPLVIVDISGLQPADIRGARRGEQATPRGPLLNLLRNLVIRQGAYAIGVDVDFSPEQNGRVPVTPQDDRFFKDCLDLSHSYNKTVLLGVYRTIGLQRDRWLGNSDYQELAANILAPRGEVTKMTECISMNGAACQDDTLAALLGKEMTKLTYAETPPAERYWGLLERFSAHQLPKSRVSLLWFPVDYSRLHSLMSSDYTVSMSRALDGSMPGNLFRDRIVLLGDANPEKSADKFIVPGEGEPVPGIYIHASAIYTLAQAPLYEPSPWGRFLIDLALAALVILPIWWIRRHYAGRADLRVAEHRLEGLLIFVVIALAIILGAAFVHLHRILWTDFVLAVLALLVHPKAERYTRWLRNVLPKAWRSIVFENAEEEHSA